LAIAKGFVQGKIHNARTLLRRYARETDGDATLAITQAADRMDKILTEAQRSTEIDSLRGHEGLAAKEYFAVFGHLLRGDPCFTWTGRSTRPPKDPVNAVLSFLSSLLATDCGAACQAVGLDVQVGYLHVERPGRPALALDLMEEFRPLLSERLLIALVNRRQLQEKHLERQEAGTWLLTDEGRKIVLTAWQERRREEITHPFLGQSTTWGLCPHLQATLLARHLRGDLDAYPPCLPD
jgi:CRISPR-associated protein Cas1